MFTMYSAEDKKRAVDLYIQYDHHAAVVIRELGYPNRHSLVMWYREYKANGAFTVASRKRHSKFSEEQKQAALKYYTEHGRSIIGTIRALGYPGKSTFKKWLNEAFPDRTKYCVAGGAMVPCPQEVKEQAVVEFCARPSSAREVADKFSVSRTSLYKWRSELLESEQIEQMPKFKKKLQSNVTSEDLAEVQEQLKEAQELLKETQAKLQEANRELYQAQLKRDVLEKAAEIIKKDQGINLEKLTNKEKTIVIDTLKETYKLKDLLEVLKIAKSSYFYQENAIHRPDKYADLRTRIKVIFNGVNRAYGYRRIHVSLRRDGIIISEKVVRRIMKEDALTVPFVKMKKYSSYQGEITPAVENLVQRDFHAEKPNALWLTDITEFHIPAGKVYLSPMIDCYDGMPVSWTIGTSPSAELVNTMLDNAISTLKDGEHPVVHTDRGCHYRWPGWIEKMNEAELTRSMSKKGCSPDNAACEGFHGRLKNEFFYCTDWRGVTIEEFTERLNKYLQWYSDERIKLSLGGMSPKEYRKDQGYI